MKNIIFGVLWLAVFAAAGTLLLPVMSSASLHVRLAFDPRVTRLGAECGADVWLFAVCFAWLPGLRRQSTSFGAAQAIWVVIGFGAMLTGAAVMIYNLLFIEDIVLTGLHQAARVDFGSRNVLMTTALAGETMAALWVAWYLGRLGQARLADATPAGIAWRPALQGGYEAAGLIAVLIIMLVLILYHLIPPNLNALQALPMAKLFDGSVLELLPLLVMVTFMAPAVEEFVFRGVAFAGLAVRLGPVWAGVVTTVLFMVVHAQEKIHYLPGFIDVGMMAAGAAWLRVRFGSIRPGILLHILYNGGLMLASGLVT